jgi:hypothetical protein
LRKKLTFELPNRSIPILHFDVNLNFQHQAFVMRNSMNDEHRNKDQSGAREAGMEGADRRAIVCARPHRAEGTSSGEGDARLGGAAVAVDFSPSVFERLPPAPAAAGKR